MDPMTLALILKAIDIVAAALVQYPELKARYDVYRAKIQVFIDENRAPTEAEFREILAEGEELTDRIAAAVAAKP